MAAVHPSNQRSRRCGRDSSLRSRNPLCGSRMALVVFIVIHRLRTVDHSTIFERRRARCRSDLDLCPLLRRLTVWADPGKGTARVQMVAPTRPLSPIRRPSPSAAATGFGVPADQRFDQLAKNVKGIRIVAAAHSRF
jgi:hypothetical protein